MDADDTWKLCLSSGMAWILYTSIIPSPFSSVNASLADIAEYVRNGSFDLIGDLLHFRLCNANVLRYGENILSGRIAAIAVYAGGVLAAQRIAVS